MAQEKYNVASRYYYDRSDYLNYEKIGSGEMNLIFLHGFGASLNSWQDIKNLFDASKYTLYLVDLKGFGFSSKPRNSEYHINEQSRIINSFLKDLSIKNVVLIGHSYGGAVALISLIDLMKQNNDSVINKMILVDAAVLPDEIPFFVSILRNPITRFFSLHFVSAEYRAKFILNRLFFNKKGVDSKKINRYAFFFKVPGLNYAMTQMALQILPINYNEYLDSYSKITKPCLIIWGNNDPIFSTSVAFKLQSSIKNSAIRIIENCGHVPQEETAQKTYELVNAFLEN